MENFKTLALVVAVTGLAFSTMVTFKTVDNLNEVTNRLAAVEFMVGELTNTAIINSMRITENENSLNEVTEAVAANFNRDAAVAVAIEALFEVRENK